VSRCPRPGGRCRSSRSSPPCELPAAAG